MSPSHAELRAELTEIIEEWRRACQATNIPFIPRDIAAFIVDGVNFTDNIERRAQVEILKKMQREIEELSPHVLNISIRTPSVAAISPAIAPRPQVPNQQRTMLHRENSDPA